MDFISHDEKTIAEMLKIINVSEVDDLFQDIPKDLIIKSLNISDGMSEPDVLNKMREYGRKNKIYPHSFLGAGCYFHYIPSLVDFVISRSEFYTSYTPYQAEASQGYLQAIYEYQSIISRLTEMEIANASMYDGSTSLAEAAIMASIITGKNQVILLEGVHPEYIDVVKTYCWGQNIELKITSENKLNDVLNEDIAAVMFQSPNFFGDITDGLVMSNKVKEKYPNCLLIQCMTDPTCLGLLKPPGKTNVDIFVAEGQSFGIDPSFGGPGLGIFTAKKKFLRKIPGRLVGKTKEINGDRDGFLLTLQAREQHIRREKASSNICTNQALCSLSALIYLVSLGKTGLREIATQNFQKAHYVKNAIALIPGYKILNKKPTYNEFIVRCPNINGLIRECKKMNLLPPLQVSTYYPEMSDVVLICVTELNSSSSIEKFIKAAKLAINNEEERAD
ncbi:MAG: aminomethyl-transferring glycine dehydrogenase subunit GcvPA [Candidatus Lokiarchaeota archaeon]|nr:aminomethyl-transferring glycine dehydrogenase subunit GcvPA [Candidatus Lokiarchaeota archaeon]